METAAAAAVDAVSGSWLADAGVVTELAWSRDGLVTDTWAAVPVVSSRGGSAGIFVVPPAADEITGSPVTSVLSVDPLGVASRLYLKMIFVEVPREVWENTQH